MTMLLKKRFKKDLREEKYQELIVALIPAAKKGMVFYSRPFDGTKTRWAKRTILGNGLYRVEDHPINVDDVNLLSAYINSFRDTTKSQLPGSEKFLTIDQTLKILYNLSNRDIKL